VGRAVFFEPAVMPCPFVDRIDPRAGHWLYPQGSYHGRTCKGSGMDWNQVTQGLLSALGIGLLIGAVRERQHGNGRPLQAGVRTHALLALMGTVAMLLGPPAFLVALLAAAALAWTSYRATSADDPGLTGEITMLTTVLLGGLALQQRALAAALGVVVAILLWAKAPLARFSRELISDQEMRDALLLAACALVVLPMLPVTAVDPWAVLVPYKLWQIVVLVMGTGMLGHVGLRAVGARWGLPVAGFLSGFASSTASVAGFGRSSRASPMLVAPSASAALLANLASLLLFAAILGTTSPALLQASAWPLLTAALVLLGFAALGLRHVPDESVPETSTAKAFQLQHALMIAVAIAAVLLLSEGLRRVFGQAGALVGATVAGLAELHAAAASIASLTASGGLELGKARWGVIALLASASLAKSVLAFLSGGARLAASSAPAWAGW
jgi:uncharacterized membrane protein (DUF4010 family)